MEDGNPPPPAPIDDALTPTPRAPVSVLPIPAPTYSMFDPRVAMLATFLGTPVAGCAVLAINYRAMGRSRYAWMTLLLGTLATGLLGLIAWLIPDPAIGLWAFYLPAIAGMAATSTKLQSLPFQDHKELGGPVRSAGFAALLGLLGLVLIGGSLVLIVRPWPSLPSTKITIGANDEVYYDDTSTPGEAYTAGTALQALGYFRNAGAKVVVTRDNQGATIGFLVSDGAWNQPAITTAFTTITRTIARKLGGRPVMLQLMDWRGKVQWQTPVQPAL